VILRLVHVFADLARGRREGAAPPVIELIPSVYRRNQPCLNREQAEKVCYLLSFIRPDSHVFSQRCAFADPGDGHCDSGGGHPADTGSVRSLVLRDQSGGSFTAFASVPVAGGMLGGVGSGLALGGPRFVPAAACTGPAGRSLGTAGHVRGLTGSSEHRGRPAGCGVAFFALRSGADPSRPRENFSMKAPELNIALSNVVKYAVGRSRKSQAARTTQSLQNASSDAPREVAAVSADRAKSRASIDE
jgi:hypothetical protein